jgi:uncharacterized SAM-binding protein YcdF (DUF218 family)
VFGGHDPTVAQHAAHLYLDNWASSIIISGGVVHPPHFYGNTQPMIEAEALKQIMIREGVANSNIFIEPRPTNTSENFWFTRDLINERELNFNSFILAQKPYAERRTYATALMRWPEKHILVSSPYHTYYEYLESGLPQAKILNMMVGEVKRIKEYPDLGYMVKQEIPEEVWTSYLRLAQFGFTERT